MFLVPGVGARGAAYVAIRAAADPAYAAHRIALGYPPPVETYVFYQGRFFPGAIRDRSLEKMPFSTIARTLAQHLQKQNYQPAAALTSADLIIVVHWGMTRAYDRSPQLLSYDASTQTEWANAVADHATMLDAERQRQGTAFDPFNNASLSIQTQANDLHSELLMQARGMELDQLASDLQGSSTAALLGFTDVLWRDNSSPLGATTDGEKVRAMLNEERYFILAMAYDCRLLVEQKTVKRLWSVRLSMRAAGVNFRVAAARLSLAGGDFFGRQSNGLLVKATRQPEGQVFLGELRVIEMDGTPVADPPSEARP